MSSKVFWKLLATALFLAYAIYQLSPLTTTPFEDFIQTRVTAKQEDFKQLLDEVRERVSAADVEAKAAGNVSQTTFYSALREISAGKGKLGKPVDLHQFFPDMLLVSDPNTERRNHYVLQEILRESQGKLKLGLDLQGGVSFTLRVDPKNFETKAEELELARKTAVREATKGLVKPDAPGLDAVQKEAAQKAWDDARAKAEKTAEADAKESAKAGELRLKEGLDRAITVMEGRVNAFGVAEPIIRRVGETSIEIQLPGKEAANNPDAINNLKKPAKLEFRMVHRYNRPEPGTPEGRIVPLREEPQNPASPIILYEVLYSRRELSARDAAESGRKAGDVEETPYYVQKTAAAAGNIVKSARAQSQDGFAWETSMSFTSAGTKKFEELTGKIADKNNEQLREYKKVINEGRLAIVLDGKLVLAPGIEIDKTTHEYRAIGGGGASIKADSQKAAADLANVLNNPLEFPLDLQNSKQIG
ncbi:MAG: hypothetical protein LBV54_03150, partial [Puniceicoccales bacterium]|nr:hypothetical protein [Puniceicoccales bacterium]